MVAVFVQGPAWQFKGWPYTSPVDIFTKSELVSVGLNVMNPLRACILKYLGITVTMSYSKKEIESLTGFEPNTF